MIFADSNGELDVEAPNTKGWADTCEFIAKQTNTPALHELCESGSTENLGGVLDELVDLESDNDDVNEVLDALDQAAMEAEDILIISA